MDSRKVLSIIDREIEVQTTVNDILYTELINHINIDTSNFKMAPVNCFKFSYLGTTRYVICDLDSRYEKIQELAAKTFRLPEECISALQFTDGKGYQFNKETFEYFIILFPQPEQKFYIRMECSKVLENRIACMEGKTEPFSFEKDTNKRRHYELHNVDSEQIIAAPLRRSNCFLGSLPENDGTSMESSIELSHNAQPRKRMRMMKSIKKSGKINPRVPQPKSVLRI